MSYVTCAKLQLVAIGTVGNTVSYPFDKNTRVRLSVFVSLCPTIYLTALTKSS